MPPLSVSVALIWLGDISVCPETAMLQAVVVLVVSTKVMTEDALKCVQPLPVMITGTAVPDAPAPGDTTATAAGGFLAVAPPVNEAVTGDVPGAALPLVAELAMDKVPMRVGLGETETGENLT